MAAQLHVAVPGEQRPQVTAHGHAVEPGIGDRDRLDHQRPVVRPAFRHREQGALERQHLIAVAAGAFGEQNQVVVVVEALIELVPVLGHLVPATLDENRALEPCQPAKQGPARDLGFGDEAAFDQGAQDHDVEVGNVIAGVQSRVGGRLLAPHLDPESHDPAAPFMIPDGQGSVEIQTEQHGERLRRHQQQGKAAVGEKPDECSEWGTENRRSHVI